MTIYTQLYQTEDRWHETRFALDRLIEAAPPDVIDNLLDRELSYGGLCFKASGVTPSASAVGLRTYRTLLAARLRVEANATARNAAAHNRGPDS